MTDEALALVEKLRALHVWPQAVADDHADLLTPRQIDKLYEVGRVSHEAATLIETQAREIERLREALKDARAFIDGDSPDWRYAKQEQLAEIDTALAGDNHDQ